MGRVSLGEELLRRAVREPKRESTEARLAAEAAELEQELGELCRRSEEAQARLLELEARAALQAVLRKRARRAPRQAL
jgi:hypothetical protein